MRRSLFSFSATSLISKTESFWSEGGRSSELQNDEIKQTLSKLQEIVLMMKVENEVYENYLKKMEPQAIMGMTQTLDDSSLAAVRLQTMASLVMMHPMAASTTTIDMGLRGHTASDVHSSMSRASRIDRVSAIDKKARINLTFRIDMVNRAAEELQNYVRSMLNISIKTRSILQVKIEAYRQQHEDIDASRKLFEQSVVIEGANVVSGRIPAEKFIRFMEENYKHFEIMVSKLRLKTSSTRGNFSRIIVQLQQKKGMGAMLCPVDYEEQKIRNIECTGTLEQKHKHLQQLKKIAGHVSQDLNKEKKKLAEQVLILNKHSNSIRIREKQIAALEEEEKLVEIEIRKAFKENAHMKELLATYVPPDTMDYMRTKAELYELQKWIKVWTRKKKIQQTMLASFTRKLEEMKKLNRPTSAGTWKSK